MDSALADRVQKRASISPCGLYRYSLERWWDTSCYARYYIMLNPSTADAEVDDPTIRRCMGLAKRDRFGGIVVLNLFAFRATSPADMKAAADPVGPENDARISSTIGGACPAERARRHDCRSMGRAWQLPQSRPHRAQSTSPRRHRRVLLRAHERRIAKASALSTERRASHSPVASDGHGGITMVLIHFLLLRLPADGPLLALGSRELWVFDGGIMLTRDRVIRWEWRKPGYAPRTFRSVLMRFQATGED